MDQYTGLPPLDINLKAWQERNRIAEHRKDANGTRCLCCGGMCKTYVIKITSVSARALINLVKAYRKEKRYYHISEIGTHKGGGDFAKCSTWGLIREKINKDTKKRCSGYWEPTEKGIQFVDHKITVESHSIRYNNIILGFSGSQVYITHFLGNRFNYAELMTDTRKAVDFRRARKSD